MTGLHAWTALGTPTLRSIISTKYRKMMRLVTARYPKKSLEKSNHCGSESSTLETDTLLVVLATTRRRQLLFSCATTSIVHFLLVQFPEIIKAITISLPT